MGRMITSLRRRTKMLSMKYLKKHFMILHSALCSRGRCIKAVLFVSFLIYVFYFHAFISASNISENDKNDRSDSIQNLQTVFLNSKKIHSTKLRFSCPSPVATDWSKHVSPQIVTHSERFLFPVLTNGPNNQLKSLWQSIFLAARLNRTLVMPEFLTHHIKNITKPVLPVPDHLRVEMTDLRRLISVVPADQMKSLCKGKFDAVLLTKSAGNRRYCMLNVIERKYGMQLLYQETKKNEDNCMKRKNIFHPHVKILPKNVDDSVKLREPSFEELTKTYGTNRRCAIHPFPWNNVVVFPDHEVSMNEVNFKNIKDLQDRKLFSLIVKNVHLPNFTNEIAQEFQRAVLGNTYVIAAHWRFDPIDWQTACKLFHESRRSPLCKAVDKVKPGDIAKAIAHKAVQVSSKESVAYIATPPASMTVAKEVKKILIERWNMKSFVAEDLENFVWKRYEGCQYQLQNDNEVLSSVEMQIAISADTFLRSKSSSWSNNVQFYRRRVNNYDILDEIISHMSR